MPSNADLQRQIDELRRLIPRGMGVTQLYGATEVRPFQVGFPAVLTGPFNATTGYPWAQLVLDTSVPGIVTQTAPRTGNMAFTPGNNPTLLAGQRGWLEVDPQAAGWIFLVDAWAGSGSGSGSGLGGYYVCTDGVCSFQAEICFGAGCYTTLTECEAACSGGGGGGGITWTPLGEWNSGTTLASNFASGTITVPAGTLISVSLGIAGSSVSGSPTVTFAGTPMNLVGGVVITEVGTAIYELHVSFTTTGTIVVTETDAVVMLSAVYVSGLTYNGVDKFGSANSVSPTTGAFGPTTQAAEYWQSACLFYGQESTVLVPGTWSSPLVSDGQDQLITGLSGLPGDITSMMLRTAYFISSATGSPDPTITGATYNGCPIVGVTYD